MNIKNIKNNLKIVSIFMVLLMSCSLFSCTKKEDNITINPTDNTIISSNLKTSKRLNAYDVIGLAAFQSFEENNSHRRNLRRNASQNNLTENTVVSYPFDAIRIHSAIKYSFTLDESAPAFFIEMLGLGRIEVVFARFSTYVKEQGEYCPSVGDELISLRGEEGMFTILSNSARNLKDRKEEIYSSHKKLSENEVIKDFQGTIYSILVTEIKNNIPYLQFVEKDDLATYHDFNDAKEFLFDENSYEKLEKEVVYEMLSYPLVEEETLEFIIEELYLVKDDIDEFYGYFTFTNQDIRKVLYFDKDTKFENINISDLHINDKIKITYDFLYEGFNPKTIYINSIYKIE